MHASIMRCSSESFPSHTYQILDTNNKQEIAEFEHAFFESFVNIDNRLIHTIWDWDFNEQRLKTRIPYPHQIISILRDNENTLVAALAAGHGADKNQFAEFGFQPHPDHTNYIECMAAFIHPASKLSPYQYGKFIMLSIENTFHHFEHHYFTCGKRQLKLYLRMGFTLLESKVINDEIRHFLYKHRDDYKISQPAAMI